MPSPICTVAGYVTTGPPPGPACPAALPLSSAMPVDHDVTVTTSELPQTSELPPTFLSMLSDTNVSMSSDHVLSATTFAEGDAVTNGKSHETSRICTRNANLYNQYNF